MRRSEREIQDPAEIKRLIGACAVCSVAFQGGDYPYVIPLNFGELWEGEKLTLYFHGAKEGTKMERMNRDNRVSFCMYTEEELKLEAPACKATMLFSSICGTGQLSVVEDPKEKLRGLECLMRHFDKETEQFEFNENVVNHTAVLKLDVVQVTGKSNRPR